MTMLKLHWNRNIWIGKGKMLNCIPWEILFCALHWTTFSSLFVCSLQFTATTLSNTNKLWTKTFLLKISPSARVWPPPPQNQLRPPKCCDNTMFFKLHFLVISHLQTFLFKGTNWRKKIFARKSQEIPFELLNHDIMSTVDSIFFHLGTSLGISRHFLISTFVDHSY